MYTRRILIKGGRINLSTVLGCAALMFFTLAVAEVQAGTPRYDETVITDDKESKVEKNVFLPETPNIYVLATLADVPTETTVKAVWIAEKTDAAPPDYEIDRTEMKAGGPMNEVKFSFSKPDAGWPVGDYRVELYIGAEMVKAVRFRVVNS